jgi:hypothetical protein
LEALKATVTIAADAAHYDVEIKAVTAGAIGKVMPWTVNVAPRAMSSTARFALFPMPRTTTSRARTARSRCVMTGRAASSNRAVVPDAQ